MKELRYAVRGALITDSPHFNFMAASSVASTSCKLTQGLLSPALRTLHFPLQDHVPKGTTLCLHAQAVTIPKWDQGRDFTIVAPPPENFKKALEALCLQLPSA